jgi:hypothetical protein
MIQDSRIDAEFGSGGLDQLAHVFVRVQRRSFEDELYETFDPGVRLHISGADEHPEIGPGHRAESWHVHIRSPLAGILGVGVHGSFNADGGEGAGGPYDGCRFCFRACDLMVLQDFGKFYRVEVGQTGHGIRGLVADGVLIAAHGRTHAGVGFAVAGADRQDGVDERRFDLVRVTAWPFWKWFRQRGIYSDKDYHQVSVQVSCSDVGHNVPRVVVDRRSAISWYLYTGACRMLRAKTRLLSEFRPYHPNSPREATSRRTLRPDRRLRRPSRSGGSDGHEGPRSLG